MAEWASVYSDLVFRQVPEQGWWKGSIASSSGSDPEKNHQKRMLDAPIMVTTGTLAPRSLGLFISAQQNVCHSVKTHGKNKQVCLEKGKW